MELSQELQAIKPLLQKSPLPGFEHVRGFGVFGLGDITLTGTTPNGHFTILMPRRMFSITASQARLNGDDLGRPSRSPKNPAIGTVNLPARPIFAVGGAYFKIQDPLEYQRTLEELRLARPY